jgi:tRNA A37 threonylcarbamoyladenosine dehydratase
MVKTNILISVLAITLFSVKFTFSQDDSLQTETDPVKAQISEIIKEVNKRSAEVDNVYSEGEIKTPKWMKKVTLPVG